MTAQEVVVPVGNAGLPGLLTLPKVGGGMVIFAHGSGSSRLSPRNRFVAQSLHEAGLGTLLFDLLTPTEEHDRDNVFDIPLLGSRLAAAFQWVSELSGLESTPIGFFGASTGAGAALWAAAELDAEVAAVVSRGGRPDLAGSRLPRVEAPTLLIVGSRDTVVVELNRQALSQLRCERQLELVPGATHLFEEPGTLEEVARLARQWFLDHLTI